MYFNYFRNTQLAPEIVILLWVTKCAEGLRTRGHQCQNQQAHNFVGQNGQLLTLISLIISSTFHTSYHSFLNLPTITSYSVLESARCERLRNQIPILGECEIQKQSTGSQLSLIQLN